MSDALDQHDETVEAQIKYWLERNPSLILDMLKGLDGYDLDALNLAPGETIDLDPYTNDYHVVPLDPDNLSYLERRVKSFFTRPVKSILRPTFSFDEPSPSRNRTNAYEMLVANAFMDWVDQASNNDEAVRVERRMVRYGECNTIFSVRTCTSHSFEDGHTVKVSPNSCHDKACPVCARKMSRRKANKCEKRFRPTGSLFISYEFTVPEEMWHKLVFNKGVHSPETEFFQLEDCMINRFGLVVNRTLREFHSGQPGGLMVIQTFSSRTMQWFPHIHVLLSDKVITGDIVTPKIKRVPRWLDVDDLDRLHDIYTKRFNEEFGTDFERIVCDRHYVKISNLRHRLRYMCRIPSMYVHSNKEGVYFDDRQRDEGDAYIQFMNRVISNAEKSGMITRLGAENIATALNVKRLPKDASVNDLPCHLIHERLSHNIADGILERGYVAEDEGARLDNPFEHYVYVTLKRYRDRVGRVWLEKVISNTYGLEQREYYKDNEVFFKNLISHWKKRNVHHFRWIGWMSNSTWRNWTERFNIANHDYHRASVVDPRWLGYANFGIAVELPSGEMLPGGVHVVYIISKSRYKILRYLFDCDGWTVELSTHWLRRHGIDYYKFDEGVNDDEGLYCKCGDRLAFVGVKDLNGKWVHVQREWMEVFDFLDHTDAIELPRSYYRFEGVQ